PFGTSWNKYKKGSNPKTMSFRRWVSNLEGIRLASTLEFPYANVSGTPVSKDKARIFGKAIAYSMMDYLKLLDE
ncbi:hypothetical protein KA005_60530, partial [bacterium]|nr:hypothetical protein [bacterium]